MLFCCLDSSWKSGDQVRFTIKGCLMQYSVEIHNPVSVCWARVYLIGVIQRLSVLRCVKLLVLRFNCLQPWKLPYGEEMILKLYDCILDHSHLASKSNIIHSKVYIIISSILSILITPFLWLDGLEPWQPEPFHSSVWSSVKAAAQQIQYRAASSAKYAVTTGCLPNIWPFQNLENKTKFWYLMIVQFEHILCMLLVFNASPMEKMGNKLYFKTWYPKFSNVTCFCNSMSPSLDNDCTIQDLAFQVLKLFGVNTFNIRPLPRIMSFMTWSSKTWTPLDLFVKTWQPQLWLMKSYTFFQDLASQVLKCYMFLQFHVPKSWQWLHYSRLGFPSLETFWGKQFQH